MTESHLKPIQPKTDCVNERKKELRKIIGSYIQAHKPVPTDWIHELNENCR